MIGLWIYIYIYGWFGYRVYIHLFWELYYRVVGVIISLFWNPPTTHPRDLCGTGFHCWWHWWCSRSSTLLGSKGCGCFGLDSCGVLFLLGHPSVHSNQHKTHPPDSLQLVFTGPIPCTDGAVVVSCDMNWKQCSYGLVFQFFLSLWIRQTRAASGIVFLFPERDGATKMGNGCCYRCGFFADFCNGACWPGTWPSGNLDPVAVETGRFMPTCISAGLQISILGGPSRSTSS